MSMMETPDPQRHEPGVGQTKMKATAGGSSLEAIGGIAAVILAILGLAHVLPIYLAAIAAIVVGAALIVEGGVMTSRLTQAATDAGVTGDVGGGLTAEFLGGAAGIVLGILAVLGIASNVLVPVAVIVFGAALLIGSGASLELSSLGRRSAEPTVVIGGAGGALVLVSIAAIVLGILALVGLSPVILSLVALLSLGAAVLFTGTTLTARMVSFINR